MVAILIANVGGFIANAYTTVYVNKLTSDDWDDIREVLNSDKYPLLLATAILSYVTNGVQAVRSCIQKCMKADKGLKTNRCVVRLWKIVI